MVPGLPNCLTTTILLVFLASHKGICRGATPSLNVEKSQPAVSGNPDQPEIRQAVKPDEVDSGWLLSPERLNFAADSDPHITIDIGNIEDEFLCFDLYGKAGDIFQLLNDPERDIKVNAEIIPRQDETSAITHTYFGRIGVVHKDTTLEITPNSFQFGGISHKWNSGEDYENGDVVRGHGDDSSESKSSESKSSESNSSKSKSSESKSSQSKSSQSKSSESKSSESNSGEDYEDFEDGDVKIHAGFDTRLQIRIGDTRFMIYRHFLSINDVPLATPYLGFYLVQPQGLSGTCGGILGEFVTLRARLDVTHRYAERNEIPGHLTRLDGQQRDEAIVEASRRLNMVSQKKVKCWHVKNTGRGMLKKGLKDYLVANIFA